VPSTTTLITQRSLPESLGREKLASPLPPTTFFTPHSFSRSFRIYTFITQHSFHYWSQVRWQEPILLLAPTTFFTFLAQTTFVIRTLGREFLCDHILYTNTHFRTLGKVLASSLPYTHYPSSSRRSPHHHIHYPTFISGILGKSWLRFGTLTFFTLHSFSTNPHSFVESVGKRFFIHRCLNSQICAINSHKLSSAGHRRVGYSTVLCLGGGGPWGDWGQLLTLFSVWFRLAHRQGV